MLNGGYEKQNITEYNASRNSSQFELSVATWMCGEQGLRLLAYVLLQNLHSCYSALLVGFPVEQSACWLGPIISYIMHTSCHMAYLKSSTNRVCMGRQLRLSQ